MTPREWFPVSSQRLRFSATGLIYLVREYSRPLTPLRNIGFSLWLLLYPMLCDPRRMAWSSRPNRVFFRVHPRRQRRGISRYVKDCGFMLSRTVSFPSADTPAFPGSVVVCLLRGSHHCSSSTNIISSLIKVRHFRR